VKLGAGVGVQVAVMGHDGSIAYEDVYAFGHRDASAVSSFVQLTMKPIESDSAVDSRTLELTAFHFVPVASGVHATDIILTSTQNYLTLVGSP